MDDRLDGLSPADLVDGARHEAREVAPFRASSHVRSVLSYNPLPGGGCTGVRRAHDTAPPSKTTPKP
jgi:hypothetical protein